MSLVLRWGRSAYETDADLESEREGAAELGLRWQSWTAANPPPTLGEADVLVVNSGTRLGREELGEFGGKLVVTTTSGVDHVDLEACRDRRIAVARLPEARRDAVVEHALWGLIAVLHRLPAQVQASRKGRWARGTLPELKPRSLRDARVVVVGLGVIGAEMAGVLRGLCAQVVGVDPWAPNGLPVTDFDEALQGADAVTLHCSLTPSSRGLMSKERLDRLPPHAVVVNTARGEVLDLQAAVERVRCGRLGGLAVDVFPVEPYPDLAASADIPELLFTPHGAGYTHDLGQKVAAGVRKALQAWTAGKPVPHQVI